MKTVVPALRDGAQFKSLEGLGDFRNAYTDRLGEIRLQIANGFANHQQTISSVGMNWLREGLDWGLASRSFGFRDGDRPHKIAAIMVPLDSNTESQLRLEATAVKGTTYLRHRTEPYAPRLGYASIALSLRSTHCDLVVKAPIDD